MEKKNVSLNTKRLSRRAFLQGAVATAGVLVTACAVQSVQTVPAGEAEVAGETASEAPPSETVELRLAYWGFEIEKQGQVQQLFMEEHPNIQLQEEVTAWGTYWQKMLTSTAGGEAPDIMHHSPYYHVQFASNNVTIPLDPFIERDGIDLSEFYEGAIASGRWEAGRVRTGQGDLHAFPSSWHSGTMWFYNKSVFDQEGVPEPDDTWTWDTLLEMCQQFTKVDSEGVAELYGMDTPVDGNGRINSWIFQAGGEFYDEEYRKCLIKSPEAMEAFQWMVDLVTKHKVALPPEPGQQFNPFETGRVAIGLQGDWNITPFENIEDFEWNIFWAPKHSQTGLNTIDAYQNGIAITSSAQDKEAAWEYLKWRLIGEGLRRSVEIFAGSFPAHIPTAEEVVYVKSRTRPPTNLWILGEMLKDAHPVFLGPAEGEIANIANEEQQAAMLDVKSVEEATDDIEARVNAVLDKAWEELTI